MAARVYELSLMRVQFNCTIGVAQTLCGLASLEIYPGPGVVRPHIPGSTSIALL